MPNKSDVITLREITDYMGKSQEGVGSNVTIEDLIRVAAGLLPKHNDIPGSNQPSSAANVANPAVLPIPNS